MNVLEALQKSGLTDEVDACLDRLDAQNQHELAGLSGTHVGMTILHHGGNLRRAAGYIHIACQSFVKSGSTGYAQHLASRFPDICPSLTAVPDVLIDIMPTTSSGGSVQRSQPTASLSETGSGTSGGLDAIT